MMLQGYRTIIVSIIISLVGFLQAVNWVEVFPTNPEAVGWIVTALGLIMAALRYFTTTPIATKS